MRRTVRSGAAVVCATVALAWPAAGAAAAGTSPERLQVVSTGERSVELLLSGPGRSLDGLDPATVRVTLDGTPADVTAERAVIAGSERAVMLVMDVSGSMRGPRMEAARTAALGFLAAAPPDVAVGLTTFASEVSVPVEPTKDREPVRRAVEAAVAAGDTKLYDALVLAAQRLDADDAAVLLSDGADDGSTATGEQAATAVTGSGASLTAVDLQADAAVTAALQALVDRAGGRVVPAGSAQAMAEALRLQADELEHQVVLSVAVPPGSGGEVVARVTAAAGERRVDVQVPVLLAGSLPAPAAPAGPASQAVSPPPAAGLWWGLGALFAALLLLGSALLGARGRRGDQRRTVQVLSRYTLRPQVAQARPLQEESVVARKALGAAARLLSRDGREKRLAALLQAAGCSLQPTEWLLLRVAAAVVGTGVLWLLAGPVGAVLGVTAGAVLPQVWLKQRAAARRRAFGDALPDALALVVGGLSSGYSFAQALDTVVREGAEPMAGEIGRALAEARLGVPLEAALEGVADRMESEDLRWVVMAVGVQREVGGSLAHVLQTVFETMRERARIRRQVRTLSAEGRVSAALLVALPIFMAVFQLLFRRDYMRPMYTEPLGLLMLAGTVVALVLGALWTRALVKVEV